MTFFEPPSITHRQNIAITSGFIAILIACVAAPRALSFLPALYGMISLLFLYSKARQWPVIEKWIVLWLLGVLGLGGLSALWAIDPAFAIERTLKTSGVFLAGYGLIVFAQSVPRSITAKNILAVVTTLSCAACALLIFSEYKTGFYISRIFFPEDAESPGVVNGFALNRSLVYLVLLTIPVMFMLYLSSLGSKAKFLLAAILLSCLGLALYCTKSQTSQIAAIFALMMVAYPAHKKIARRLMIGAIAILMLAIPFVIEPAYEQFLETSLHHKPSKMVREASVVHRLEVWNFIAGKIQEKPLFGYGIEATRFLESDTVMENMKATTVLHPHNIFLQIWIEFGIVGTLLAIAFLAVIMKKLDTMPPNLQRYYSIVFISIICVTSIGYGMWQGWQIGMIFALISFSILIARLYEPSSD